MKSMNKTSSRILVVDDEESVLQICSETLQKLDDVQVLLETR